MPAIVMALVGWAISALRQYLPGIVGRVLLTLGIGFATQTVAMPALMAFVQTRVSGMPLLIQQYFVACGFDVLCSMTFSALAAVAAQRVMLKHIGGAA